MQCRYPNSENVLDKICGKTATWIVQASTLGYPVNAEVAHPQQTLCDIHALAVITGSMADPARKMAALRIMRIEHAEAFAETEALRGRRIGK